MEYLVSMTTQVPDGTPSEAVDEIRAREAAHSRELAAAGQLLRLWRPPVAPGEWRTLGLFAAADPEQLEEILASMPLRVWRTDEVKALVPHSNDPPSPVEPTAPEFLTTFTLNVPPGTPGESVEAAQAGEARRTAELAAEGHFIRLWRIPAEGKAIGLWQAKDAAELAPMLASLPLADWLTVEITPLDRHPNDPARP
jgi:muconolactone delta-isomerase